MRLECRDLTYAYPKSPGNALKGLTHVFESGSYWAVVGPNGAGKSTLLKMACGLLPLEAHSASAQRANACSVHAYSGEVLWDSKPLLGFAREELARKVAFVPAGIRAQFPVTVFEFVLQGRYAYGSYWKNPTAQDRELAQTALSRTGVARLRDCLLPEVSAGELQLALLARAIAQTPEVYFLDETTSHLDLAHQARVFKLLAELHAAGSTVVLVSHDLNLAAEFCPNLLWLKDGRVAAAGPTESVLNAKVLQEVYGITGETTGCLEVGKNPFSGKPKVFWRP